MQASIKHSYYTVFGTSKPTLRAVALTLSSGV